MGYGIVDTAADGAGTTVVPRTEAAPAAIGLFADPEGHVIGLVE